MAEESDYETARRLLRESSYERARNYGKSQRETEFGGSNEITINDFMPNSRSWRREYRHSSQRYRAYPPFDARPNRGIDD